MRMKYAEMVTVRTVVLCTRFALAFALTHVASTPYCDSVWRRYKYLSRTISGTHCDRDFSPAWIGNRIFPAECTVSGRVYCSYRCWLHTSRVSNGRSPMWLAPWRHWAHPLLTQNSCPHPNVCSMAASNCWPATPSSMSPPPSTTCVSKVHCQPHRKWQLWYSCIPRLPGTQLE